MKTINDTITIKMPAYKAYLIESVLKVSSMYLKDIDIEESNYLEEFRKLIINTLEETFKEEIK